MIKFTVAPNSEIGTPGNEIWCHPDTVWYVTDETTYRHIYLEGVDGSGNKTDLYVEETLSYITTEVQKWLPRGRTRTPDYGRGSRIPVSAPGAPSGGSGGLTP